MTTVSTQNNSALLILQQSNSTSSGSKERSTAEQITTLVNGISAETSSVKSQVSSAINSALLDVKEKQDSTVQAAFDFIASDKFQSSDPTLKDTLKKIISENGEDFAKAVQTQQAKNSGISLENAIANALAQTITSNRSSFSSDEIVIGIQFPGGGVGLQNISALDGSNSYESLMSTSKAESAERRQAIQEAAARGAPSSDIEDITRNSSANKVKGDIQDWANKWFSEFGWDVPDYES